MKTDNEKYSGFEIKKTKSGELLFFGHGMRAGIATLRRFVELGLYVNEDYKAAFIRAIEMMADNKTGLVMIPK